jgi:hypothetical protein
MGIQVKENYYSKSKRFAWALLAIATMLSVLAMFLKMEGAAVAFWSTSIPSAVLLYSNKQYQERKKMELQNKSKHD